jgi:serine/threonine protein kinase
MLMSVKALGEVHNLKLVHKDIKPHNIILNKSNGVEPKLNKNISQVI